MENDGRIAVWNYLRIRGEKSPSTQPPACESELPPHTRRKVGKLFHRGDDVGTTSAYAEKSNLTGFFQILLRNYLRIRGEKAKNPVKPLKSAELPPHTRRKG
ncbi:Hypothetical protein Cul210932_0034 [Corynebacterium ulcerans]|nr:Hypothetical protein Cul210932_0034 [Corynebacterium ulcerans]ALD93776.1 Hypothetical protein Cul131001_0035 [Corynebacterium ulcerans]